jgi:site-specific DNA recombinase
VTAEIKKNRYTYYHCTGYRGKCALPYTPEAELGAKLGQILKDIRIPDDVLAKLENSLRNDKNQIEEQTKAECVRLVQRLAQVRGRIERAYSDKLDGKITEKFRQDRSEAWNCEEQQILMALQGLDQQSPERISSGIRILELANGVFYLS